MDTYRYRHTGRNKLLPLGDIKNSEQDIIL